MKTTYFGEISFQAWEFLSIPFLLMIIFLISTRIQSQNIRKRPEYRYYMLGLFSKVIGGVVLGLIYIFYYGGGDTIAYYESGLAFVNLFERSFSDFWVALFSEASSEVRFLFDNTTGYPLSYIHYNIHTFTVVRFVTPLLIVSMKSYLIATMLMAWISYFGIWRAYLLFCEFYPDLRNRFAIAFLFIPSVLFWGSGILKDTLTLSAACWFVVSFHDLFIRRRRIILQMFYLLIASYVMLSVKPYVFMVILPGALMWLFFSRLKRIKNRFLVRVIVPFVYIGTVVIGLGALSLLGGLLGEYSLDKVLTKAAVTQNDLKQDYYDGNSFDIGTVDASVTGILSKAPIGVVSGLFRPFLWEVRNVVMLFSSIENTFFLLFTLWVIFNVRITRLGHYLQKEPLLLFALSFSILFAFTVGLTTPNFGALVRFKIPLIPFFICSLFIIMRLNYQEKLEGYQKKLAALRYRQKKAEEAMAQSI